MRRKKTHGKQQDKDERGERESHRNLRKVAHDTVWAGSGPGIVSEQKEVGGPLSVRQVRENEQEARHKRSS